MHFSDDLLRNVYRNRDNYDFTKSYVNKIYANIDLNLIFGRGDVINEYWFMTYILEDKDSVTIKDNTSFNGVMGYLRKTRPGIFGCESPKSNRYISFYDDGLFVSDDYRRYPQFKSEFKMASPYKRSEFFARMDGSKYSIRKTDVEHVKNGTKKEDENSNELKHYTYANIVHFLVRRACKFLMYDVINRGGEICYVLDGLDILKIAKGETVALKNKSGHSRDKIPVCTSEIQELFRAWPYFRGKVHFFKEFKQVPPPWEGEYCEYWRFYVDKLFVKYKGNGSLDDKTFDSVKEDTPTCERIRIYHSKLWRNISSIISDAQIHLPVGE